MTQFMGLAPSGQTDLRRKMLAMQLLQNQQAPQNIGQGISQAGSALAQALIGRQAIQQQGQQEEQSRQRLAQALQGLPPEAQQALGPLAQDPQMAPMIQQALAQRSIQQALPEPISPLQQQQIQLQRRGLNLDEQALQARQQQQAAQQQFRQQQASQDQSFRERQFAFQQEQANQDLQLQFAKLQAEQQSDPRELAEFEQSLRKEFNGLDQTKQLAKALPAIESAMDTIDRDTLASDLNLVFAVGKTFDPESVVREGEQVTIANAQALPDRLVGMIKAANGGSRLSAETRQALLTELQSRANAMFGGTIAQADQFRSMASEAGARPNNVVNPKLIDRARRVIGGGSEQPGGNAPAAPAPQRLGEANAGEARPQPEGNGGFSLNTDVTKLTGDELDAYARWLEQQGF